MDFVAMHGVPPLRYDFDDLERERLSSNADNKPSETPGA
jgi:hypothetical protein